MSKSLKYGLLISGIGLISLISFIGFGFYTMQIEDHYGDAQDLYYKSKTGDIIVNRTTSEFGIVEKDWKSIRIRTKEISTVDLYNWIHQDGRESSLVVYRPTRKVENIEKMTFSELIKTIDKFEFKEVLKKIKTAFNN